MAVLAAFTFGLQRKKENNPTGSPARLDYAYEDQQLHRPAHAHQAHRWIVFMLLLSGQFILWAAMIATIT